MWISFGPACRHTQERWLNYQEITAHSAAGHIRKIPLLTWHQMGQMATNKDLPGVIQAEALVETTDVSGTRTFALKVLEPLPSRNITNMTLIMFYPVGLAYGVRFRLISSDLLI